jgi:hypothetical protein
MNNLRAAASLLAISSAVLLAGLSPAMPGDANKNNIDPYTDLSRYLIAPGGQIVPIENTFTPAKAATAQVGNASTINQIGANNSATVNLQGLSNSSSQTQIGLGNSSVLSATGDDNNLRSSQLGYNNSTAISVVGNNNNISNTQIGANLNYSVTQVGNGKSLSVTQTGVGAK